ncbi:hypothetical protein Lal_00012185 [Lupinus albus]|nr:hypothetical protein Lal_00012185 [Lupinus albus]
MSIINKMRIYGDKTDDVLIVEKILRSWTPKFNFVACAIEEANDVERGKGSDRNRGVRNNNDRGNQQQNHYREGQIQGRGGGRGGHHSPTYRSKLADKSNVECFRCHRYGHYKSECQTDLNKQSGDQSNFIENEEKLSLLMVCHMKEETQPNMWYLDTCYSNHMCEEKNAFSDLDESFRSSLNYNT